MRKISVLFLSMMVSLNAYAATPMQRRGGVQNQSGAGASTVNSARSAVAVRGAKPATASKSAMGTSAARSAVAGRTTVPRGASNAGSPVVSARAGATQKVIGGGTKVATATQNTAINEACQQKFKGCMDAFCMTENVSGGRCQCSNRNAELAKQLAEIEELDAQSYKLATVGVEVIESGVDAATLTGVAGQKKSRLDLSAWNATAGTDDEPLDSDDIKNKTGAALMSAATDVCMARMPECADSVAALRTMYAAQIKNDCAAYENAIKQSRTEAQSRLDAANASLRSAALDSLRTANKYDLGQCTIEFKKCMTTTGGCGQDWKGCVGIAAAQNAQKSVTSRSGARDNKMKMYDITGASTKISIAASSYDALDSKRPLCASVLNSCQNVKDQVWDTFLREVAPQIKTAELLAESDLRTSCIANISDCFQKACKDNIDPKDPDGSYDMCLTRPETVKSLCKVQIDPCEAAEPLILDYVYARLAAMRVDSCTKEVKQCLQSEDRCGEDYTQCVGLDTDTIVRMCPYDKLVGCQQVYTDKGIDIRGDDVYDELAKMVQGIMLNIDNNMLEFCQNAANEAMVKVCGDTENCNTLATDDHIGAGSLEYKICEYSFSGESASIDYSKCRTNIDQIQDVELGRVPGSTTGELGPVTPFAGLLDGMMWWELVTVDDNGDLTGPDKYFELSTATEVRPEKKEQMAAEIKKLQSSVNMAVSAIEADPTVQYCMTGRKVQGMKDLPIGGKQDARFPKLTKQMKNIIATSALSVAKDNYYKKYDAQYEQMMQDYVKIAERQAEIRGENAKDVRREAARMSCVSLADMASLPMSPPPPTGWGMWLVAGVVAAAAAAAVVFTGGASGFLVGLGVSLVKAGASVTVAAAAISAGAGVAAGLVGAGIGAAATSHSNGDSAAGVARELSGHHEMHQWNWKQDIDTTFEWETLKCKKCVKSTKCSSQSYPLFGRPKCKKWEESTTDCTETQF